MKSRIFWSETPCSLVRIYQNFRGIFRVQEKTNQISGKLSNSFLIVWRAAFFLRIACLVTLRLWRWRQYVPQKQSAQCHMPEESTVYSHRVRTSNLTNFQVGFCGCRSFAWRWREMLLCMKVERDDEWFQSNKGIKTKFITSLREQNEIWPSASYVIECVTTKIISSNYCSDFSTPARTWGIPRST
jgi:hypothetical protein